MPLKSVINKDHRLVITTAFGAVIFDEVKAHQDALLKDPNFHPEYDQLIDATGMISFDLSADEVRTVAFRKLFSKTSKRAWVASRPSVFGMGRMAGTYHEVSEAPSEVNVFSDMPSALEWLGLEAFDLDSLKGAGS